MESLEEGLVLVLAASALGVALVFGLYPMLVALCALVARRRRGGAAPGAPAPSVSLLVALRNAQDLVDEKVENALALGAPELVLVSDGSRDATAERLREAAARAPRATRVTVLELPEHVGKAAALNRGAALCRGDVLVFSDADALLAPDALVYLLAPYADPGVGGVCGQRVLHERGGELGLAQGRYIAADSALKRAESRVGSVTSNDGKLYSIRRALFRPIAAGATDDLYTCLSVVEQGYRFVFEPRARAFIRTPSRSAPHELARRRRIVARSLRGIFLKRALLNPLRFGSFALQLLVNKVFRRLLPLFLVGLFLSSLALSFSRPWALGLLLGQVAFYLLAVAHAACARTPLAGPAAVAWYFCLGNVGTLLGLGDFLRRRETIKWDPLKAD